MAQAFQESHGSLEFLTAQFLPFSMRAEKGLFKTGAQGFPGGAVVKNPPANAGDTGSSPGPERSHMLRSN